MHNAPTSTSISTPLESTAVGSAEPLVLVVEDVRATRDRLTRVLRTGGYGVITANDGRDALRALAMTPHVDAILLDLVMPSMNGWEFREFQLRDARLASIPTLVLTVDPLQEHERYKLRIGSATLIQKPFEDWQVLDRLSRIFSRLAPPAMPEEQRWMSKDGTPLLWSKRGRVACEAHAPKRDALQWTEEGWTWIPRFAGKSKIEYSCQECAGGPIRHRSAARRLSV